jgi:glutamine amidotransferase
MKKVVVLDYGSGNLRSAQRALERGVDGPAVIAKRLAALRPVLGICVGMQVLFTAGVEHGEETAGLGVLPGRVERLAAPVLPHMGWNTVAASPGSKLFAGMAADTRFYFVHSYALRGPTSGLVSRTEYGEPFVAAVEDGLVTATQFHPEKSGDAGLTLLENWLATL